MLLGESTLRLKGTHTLVEELIQDLVLPRRLILIGVQEFFSPYFGCLTNQVHRISVSVYFVLLLLGHGLNVFGQVSLQNLVAAALILNLNVIEHGLRIEVHGHEEFLKVSLLEESRSIGLERLSLKSPTDVIYNSITCFLLLDLDRGTGVNTSGERS